MKLDTITVKNDECYTPRYAIEPILKYLTPNSRVWCPFDTEESLFVKVLREAGHEVIATHIDNGQDFFTYEPEEFYSYIISNPPYSLKTEVLARLFSLGKPFAMLIGVVGLFESQERFELFRDNRFEIMYFNRRVAFFGSFEEQKPRLNPPFSSVYITSHLLPRDIVFEEIKKI